MSPPDLSAAIARLRLGHRRKADIMAVCDALEARTVDLGQSFDRVEYQRIYMRDMRAARKAGMSTAEYRSKHHG